MYFKTELINDKHCMHSVLNVLKKAISYCILNLAVGCVLMGGRNVIVEGLLRLWAKIMQKHSINSLFL
jgi:hypothetical protein